MKSIKTSIILKKALDDIKKLYSEIGIDSGNLVRIALKKEWNVVIGSKGQCGCAMNFTGIYNAYGEDVKVFDIEYLRSLIGKNLFDIVEMNLDKNDLQKNSLALACLNALSQPLVSDDMLDRRGIGHGKDIFSLVKPNDVVTIVGFGGMVRQFTGKCKKLNVTDLRPKEYFMTTVIGDKIDYGPKNIYFYGEEGNKEAISGSDAVFISGSTLVNVTFDELVSYAKNARLVSVYGPSCMLLPDTLFNNGVNVVQSVRILDQARLEYDMYNDFDMEHALKLYQEKYLAYKV